MAGMDTTIGAQIVVANPTPELEAWANTHLVLVNPAFYKNLEAGRSNHKVPERIVLYEQVGNLLILPFGCFTNVWKFIAQGTWKALFQPIRPVTYESRVRMRPYQESAVNAVLSGKNGLLIAPPGSGKTQMGLEIIKRIGGRALWLTHTSDLLSQSMLRAVNAFGDFGMGTITEGKVNIGERITFATVQTMSGIDVRRYADYWDVIIVDECHHVSGSPTQIKMFYKVLSELCARHKFGLTATPERSDGMLVSMYAILGNKLHEIPRSAVAQDTCPVKVKPIPFDLTLSPFDVLGLNGTIEYIKTITAVVEHKERNETIASLIRGCASAGGHTLVLSERVKHLQDLQSLAGCGVIWKAGSKKRPRDTVMYATYALLSEGFDMAELDKLVLASPTRNRRLVTQACGRVQRKCDGKDFAMVYDIMDDWDMFITYGKERMRIYKQLGFEVIQ